MSITGWFRRGRDRRAAQRESYAQFLNRAKVVTGEMAARLRERGRAAARQVLRLQAAAGLPLKQIRNAAMGVLYRDRNAPDPSWTAGYREEVNHQLPGLLPADPGADQLLADLDEQAAGQEAARLIGRPPPERPEAAAQPAGADLEAAS